jgi:RNA polymerase sigma-70 factor (ECF subfamily)
MLMAVMDDIAAPAVPIVMPRPNTAALVTATYDAHQRELYSFALRSSRDPETAEDLVQEAFIRLIVEIDADRTPTNIRAWLYRVIANLVVSGGRRATVARRQLGALVENDVDDGPEPAYLEHERQSALETALAGLGIAERTALVMAASGFKGLEIAEAIGRSGSATRTMMCRTRLQLRNVLGSIEATA